MDTVNVALPSALLKAVDLEEKNLSQEAKHGVPPLRYSFEELEEERQSSERLGV